ncbi:MAG: PKD domain-containing protein [Bacteroidetes bacterium]|nr:MAG: PKD domain-containing protein [Bacteroidota bacterium]
MIILNSNKEIFEPLGKYLIHIHQKTAGILFHLLLFTIIGFGQTSPVANFSATPRSGCSPLIVSFQDLSTGNPTSWNWDFGNGQLSTLRNPIVNYSIPGTYTVRLVVRNSAGIDEEIKTNFITVTPSPSASLSANITTACAPATIQFTDQSTVPPGAGTIISWLWDFGDGFTSTSQNPSHTYTAIGFYTVSLRITSTTGCQSFTSIGRYIRIVSGITADFSFSQPGTCQAPFTINFQDLSSGPGTLSYVWDFGNGGPTSTLQNPSATYAAAGTYTVRLNVQSDLGCSGTITKNVVITGKTTNFNIPPSICIGQMITFQNNSSPAPISSFWDFGDGTTSSQINPDKTFLSGGTYPVKLINNYGNCIDSITRNVTITSQPPVNFTLNDSTACRSPFTVQFTDISPAASTWLWNFGDGGTSNLQNPSHTYTSGGVFDVSLTITLPGGCTNTITKPQLIKILNTTVAIANAPTGGCIPFSYSPIPQIQSVDNIISYLWDLGEPGGIYTTQFPTHIYNTAGNYTISLTVTTQTGCTETITIPNGVRTGTRPTVNFSFTPNNVCASTPVQFTDLSVTSPGAFVEWDWDFGDSLFSTLQNPQHIYEDTGALTVKLVVSNNGCRDSAFRPIQILPPVAKFGYMVDCNNRLRATFLDSSLTNPIYGPITYEWRMGDPANTIFFGLPPPTFTYPAYGTYTATLIVTNGACSYQRSRQIILVNETPSFTINKNPVCKSEVFTLNAVVSNPANIRDYSWLIGATAINDTTRTLNYSLGNYGSYDVALTIEDINGCFDTTLLSNFIVVSGPRANFSVNGPGGCVNSTISFTDLSIPNASPITQWNWNFGDGNQQTFTSSPFTHTYTQTGSYTVSLAIKDNANCADTITLPNSVLITRPVAAFRADSFYCPLAALQFTDTSSGSGLTYNWSFGDGGTSTLQNPTHIYPLGDNIYNVKLTIQDAAGCKDSVLKTNYIYIRSPRAAFDIIDSSGICIPLQTSFVFQGSNYQSHLWDFGDGSSNAALNPSHFYNAYGAYTATLYLTGPGGCIDSASKTVNLYNPALATQITLGPDTACHSITTNFNISVPVGFNFQFYFGDGSSDTTRRTSLTHTYNSPGNFFPYLILTDKFGCNAVVSAASPVIVYGAIPLFGKDKKEFCDTSEVFFTNYSLSNDPIISNVWNFGDGTTSTATDPSHFYNGADTYIVTLTVTTVNQCSRSFFDTVRVYPTPVLSLNILDTLCVNKSEIFSGVLFQPDSTIKWQWTLGNGNTAQTQQVAVSYNSPGNYPVQLIASNKLGCADTARTNINVVPLPTATPVTDPITIISGTSTELAMNYTGPIVSYNWLPPTRLDCTNCPRPEANPQFTTKYSVTVTDRYGCINKGDVTVQVICTGQNFFVPNTFSPNGDGSNDVFYLRGTGIFRVKTLRIFNRWGEVVFENREVPVNNPGSGWNGNYKGKPAQSDVYIYQLEILCANGELIKYSGNIALIR